MQVGSIASQAAYQPTPQSAVAASQAGNRVAAQAAQAKASQTKAAGTDGDGDHGVEPQGSAKGGAGTASTAPTGSGLFLNRTA